MQGSGLVLENSLQAFFYDQLKFLNDKSLSPLSNESIFYSSLVMDKFGESENLFEVTDSGVKNKVLGIKLLEANKLSIEQQKRSFKEIADTSLFICGYFAESMNRKIVDIGYYQKIGVAAYRNLNNLIPEFYDVENFYKKISYSFLDITNLMGIVADKTLNDFENNSIVIINKKRKSA